MDKLQRRNFITKRIARELPDGSIVNLGIGMPTLVANHVPENVHIIIESENGVLGVGPAPKPGFEDPDYTNAGGTMITALPGASFFDSAVSFGLIRGGHIDITVLGALQVDQDGNLASWTVPGKRVNGMGGAMDLVISARRVIVAMEQKTVKGELRLLEKCTFPLTAVGVVHRIVTEMAVIDVVPGRGFVLRETAPGLSIDDVRACVGAKLHVDGDVTVMQV